MHKFSYVSCQLYIFALSFDWFIGLCVPFVIGQNNYSIPPGKYGLGGTRVATWELVFVWMCPVG